MRHDNKQESIANSYEQLPFTGWVHDTKCYVDLQTRQKCWYSVCFWEPQVIQTAI